jgi:hypothetical protein
MIEMLSAGLIIWRFYQQLSVGNVIEDKETRAKKERFVTFSVLV